MTEPTPVQFPRWSEDILQKAQQRLASHGFVIISPGSDNPLAPTIAFKDLDEYTINKIHIVLSNIRLEFHIYEVFGDLNINELSIVLNAENVHNTINFRSIPTYKNGIDEFCMFYEIAIEITDNTSDSIPDLMHRIYNNKHGAISKVIDWLDQEGFTQRYERISPSIMCNVRKKILQYSTDISLKVTMYNITLIRDTNPKKHIILCRQSGQTGDRGKVIFHKCSTRDWSKDHIAKFLEAIKQVEPWLYNGTYIKMFPLPVKSAAKSAVKSAKK